MGVITYSAFSACIGWAYTFLWSASFFPQAIFNWRRKSTRGTNIDFPAINNIGFAAYLSSNIAFLFSDKIRAQYALRNHSLTPTVTYNDLAFSVIAVVSTATLTSQYLLPQLWNFTKISSSSHEIRLSVFVQGVISGCLLGVLCVAIIVAASPHKNEDSSSWADIDTVYSLSYVKLIVTLIKYSPQVYTNYLNKSTAGWSILQIVFDFAGGGLSLLQLFLDAWLQNDWSGITGNPVKLGLGLISMTYDCIFFVQHYILYRGQSTKDQGSIRESLIRDEEQPLLTST